jgi:hypothetical protein
MKLACHKLLAGSKHSNERNWTKLKWTGMYVTSTVVSVTAQNEHVFRWILGSHNWNYEACSFLGYERSLITFGGTKCLNPRGCSFCQATQSMLQCSEHCFLLWGSLLRLLLEPEDGGNISIRNINKCLSHYTASHSRRQYSPLVLFSINFVLAECCMSPHEVLSPSSNTVCVETPTGFHPRKNGDCMLREHWNSIFNWNNQPLTCHI